MLLIFPKIYTRVYVYEINSRSYSYLSTTMVVILVVSFSSTSDAAKQPNQPIPYAQDLSVERRNVEYVIFVTHVWNGSRNGTWSQNNTSHKYETQRYLPGLITIINHNIQHSPIKGLTAVLSTAQHSQKDFLKYDIYGRVDRNNIRIGIIDNGSDM